MGEIMFTLVCVLFALGALTSPRVPLAILALAFMGTGLVLFSRATIEDVAYATLSMFCAWLCWLWQRAWIGHHERAQQTNTLIHHLAEK